MHFIAKACTFIIGPLTGVACLLAAQLSKCGPHGAPPYFFIATAIVAAVVVAVGCGGWAMLERMRTERAKECLSTGLFAASSRIRLRDALLESFSESIVVLTSKDRSPLSFKRGAELLVHCLAGPDAATLAAAVDDLLRNGTEFNRHVRTISVRGVFVKGRRVCGKGTLYFKPEPEVPLIAPPPRKPRENYNGPTIGTVITETHREPKREETENSYIVIRNDGRIKTYSSAFAAEWGFDEHELQKEPYLRTIGSHYAARFGHDEVLKFVASASKVEDPESLHAWGPLTRSDGRRFTLCFQRLPDGCTRAAFENATAPMHAVMA